MSRSRLVFGNWKMHGSRSQNYSLIIELLEATAVLSGVTIVVFPPYPYITQIGELLTDSPIAWGGQNLSHAKMGAYTGEVSASMLKDLGCQYVIVGHSERRSLYSESNKLVAQKFSAAVESGLTPVLCVGETAEQRTNSKFTEIISAQLNAVIECCGIASFSQAVIAYEPVWAIGTGVSATAQQASEAHEFIRAQLADLDYEIALNIPIIYGGSIKANNAVELFTAPEIDGGLVGGASLNAPEFSAICEAAII